VSQLLEDIPRDDHHGASPENARVLGVIFSSKKESVKFLGETVAGLSLDEDIHDFPGAMNALDPVYRVGKQLNDVYGSTINAPKRRQPKRSQVSLDLPDFRYHE